MRVIAGEFGGRKLVAPAGDSTRPILDRVKVALFDWLGARLAMPGTLPPLCAADLFCGGGSLGIEALSRGAAFCAFVEKERAALACLRTNIESLGIADRCVVHSGPAESVRLESPPSGEGFGLVFCDPPYALSRDVSTGSVTDRVMTRLGASAAVRDDCLVAWRHDASDRLPAEAPGGWTSFERREWGTMAVTLFRRSSQTTR